MQGCTGIIEPEPKFINRHGLFVAYSISTSRNGLTITQMLNPTFAPVTIGLFQPVDSNVHLVETVGYKQKTPNRESLLPQIITTMKRDLKELTESEWDQLQELLMKYAEIISTGDGDIERTSKIKHQIDTQGAAPIKQTARRLPFYHQEEVCNMLDKMMKQDVIEPALGPWSSPGLQVQYFISPCDSFALALSPGSPIFSTYTRKEEGLGCNVT